MNPTAQFIKARWRLLLCLTALLALIIVALLNSSPTMPLRSFVIATNEYAGVQWISVAVTNVSPRTYSVIPITEVMVGKEWRLASKQLLDIVGIRQSPFGDRDTRIPSRSSVAFRAAVPSESTRWRVKFICTRQQSDRERNIVLWCRRAHLPCPFGTNSEHTIEFGK
jgi:hypothetical protein